jgi:hypothetical protein
MTAAEASETTTPAKAPVIEGPGRYVVYQGPESWKIARAVGICDRCQSCGCGEQAEPVDIPDFSQGRNAILAWAMKNMNHGLLGSLRGVMGRG